MLKKVLHFNNVSKELLDSIPKLKRGEIRTFKSLSIKPDHKNPRKFVGPYIDNILCKDIIWDEAKQEYVEIAFVDQTLTNKGDAVPVFKTIKFVAPNGEVTVRGGSAEDEYKYYFLMLTNQNISNANRDASKPASFKLVDIESEKKQSRGKRNKTLDALNKAVSMTPDEVRDFVAATGSNEKQPLEVLRDIVESWAEKDPEDFLKRTLDPEVATKATVRRALDHDIIKFDKEQMLFTWGSSGEPIMTVARAQDNDHVREFVQATLTNKRYEKVLPEIRKALKR
jgi:hypothetical protein